MIKIPIHALKKARTLLTRLPFTRSDLPVLGHVLVSSDVAGLTLAVSYHDQWLETRLELPDETRREGAFLIPAEALATAVKADKDSEIRLRPKGRAGHRELKVVTISGGMKIETTHPTADWEDFPERPVIDGPEVEIPAATFEVLQVVSPCASRDQSRQVLNGVLFTPEEGEGMLIATDGRRLAGVSAVVPGRSFILPNAAVRVLAHRDFAASAATVVLPQDATSFLVAVRSGSHTLLSRTLEGSYPAYKQVIPERGPAGVTIPEERKPGLIRWLRGLRCDSVCLSVERPGELTLARGGKDGHATLRVPAAITGTPPAISFNPAYLAEALEIGATLRLSDEMSPGMTEGPGGRFCVLMPMRTTVSQEVRPSTESSPAAA